MSMPGQLEARTMGLHQANLDITAAYEVHRQDRLQARRLRQPIEAIDGVRYELEELQVRGQRRVPLAFESRLKDLAQMVGRLPLAGSQVGAALQDLRVKIGIVKLMEALYTLQECVFALRARELGVELVPDFS
jgi:hypothetical protein